MKVCGLTGGVGMGKSTAAGFLLAAGIRVVDTDDLARQLVQPGQPALAEIAKTFGAEILARTGELKRDALARRVFGDPAARQQLEALLHPRIRAGWLSQLEGWRAEHCPLAFVVIPLLYETRAEAHFENILCVACSPAAQHDRLARRGWNAEQIQQRIAAQWPTEQKIARADFVLWTDGLLAVQQQQIEKILPKL